MRKYVLVAILSGAFTAALPVGALAGNPNGTGPPSQSCQDIEKEGGKTPGHASSSPGSPFNEPTETEPGGTGGENYTEKSQYDVACYHVSANH